MEAKLWRRVLAIAVCVCGLALVGSSSASAAACTLIQGAGSSLQLISQTEVWAPLWKADKSPSCGAEVNVTYRASSSGKGKAQWGSTSGKLTRESANELALTEMFPAFIGSDTGAGTTQEEKMKTAGGTSIVTVPVEQSAVSVLIHAPLGCEPEKDTQDPVVSLPLLAQTYLGVLHNFDQLAPITWVGLSNCLVDPLLIVRSSGSGTTAGFKRALGCSDLGTTLKECKNEFEHGEWKKLNESTEESESTNWPTTVDKAAATGQELVSKVRETPSSIGYADLADARNGSFDVGLWLHIGNLGDLSWYVIALLATGVGADEPLSPQASNGESNCGGAKYTEESSKEVGPEKSWGLVRQTNVHNGKAGEEPSYPICTLTFDLAWHNYGSPKNTELGIGYGTGEAESVVNYLLWIVNGSANSKVAEKHYGALPKNIQKKTEEGLLKSPIEL